MFLSALDVATAQRWGKPLASTAAASLAHSGVNSSGASMVVVSSTSQACPHPTTTQQTLQKVQLPYQLPEQARVNRTSHTSAGVQMKAAWPAESAKYARAAGFAFVFLLFINACIYLLFGPRAGKGGGKGWEPGGRQTGGLVSCLPPLLKA